MPQQYVQARQGSGQFAPQPGTTAGPPRTVPTQASQPPSSSHRQTSHSSAAPPPQDPRTIALGSSAAPAPAPTQQPQASTPQPSTSDSLPTPPPTAHANPGGTKIPTLEEAATMAAMRVLKPFRDSFAESLAAAHKSFASEFSGLHNLIMLSDNRFRAAVAHCTSLQKECARVTAERDAAVKFAEQLKKDKESAIEAMQKMNTNLPKLVVEYYELKSDHAELQRKMAALEEENAQLREKAQGKSSPVYSYESVFAAPASPVEQKVKLEDVVKQERSSPPDSPSSDIDAAFAAELAQEHQLRKRRQRDIDELKDILQQGESLDLPILSSIPSTSYVPPTPISPLIPSFPPDTAPVASTSAAPSNSTTSDASSLAVKAEQCDAMPHSGIPDLTHLDLSGELDIIDLTATDTSPMQLTSDLPPLSRRVHEVVDIDRKRVLAAEENDSEQPSKKQRTDEGVQAELADADTNMVDVQPTVSVDVSTTGSQSTDAEMQPAEVPATPPPAASFSRPEVQTAEEADPSTVGTSTTGVDDLPMEAKTELAPEVAAPLPSLSASSPPLPTPVSPPPHPSAPLQPVPALDSVPAPSPITVPRAPQPTPTQSPIVDGLSSLSLPSSSSTVQLPPPVVVKPQPAKGLSVAHLSLMYETRRDKLYCRVCVARSKKFSTPPTIFPENAGWNVLKGHYENEHPVSCGKLIVMSPEQIREKKAENESKKVPFPFVTKKRKGAP
ncbi:hypothetical protein L226DRAFT_574847 [Lentinus tigrinus ALCF2SS1-7]|uniref:Uncharacterized protein n=1 Tax=Lentinus tigrinus ALCF2SS1-6 TaxID=1328759 RepID=A0A5C2RTV7_9APHY|nr:hypothetical protein L227DRAFT_314413 [Lentinus tigrinus ALCF2SS1-6]RPD70320.1 hypothetical protein L226DRAFT_574847 [Lentinus tigrinus ALCF2SS1-7]